MVRFTAPAPAHWKNARYLGSLRCTLVGVWCGSNQFSAHVNISNWFIDDVSVKFLIFYQLVIGIFHEPQLLVEEVFITGQGVLPNAY